MACWVSLDTEGFDGADDDGAGLADALELVAPSARIHERALDRRPFSGQERAPRPMIQGVGHSDFQR